MSRQMCLPKVQNLRAFLFLSLLCPALFFAFAPPCRADGADTLTWNTNKSRVTADIRSGQLVDVLRRVAATTGWKVLIEPGISQTVSAKFKDLTPGEALRKLLGDVNFALLPGSNTAPRLLVFRTASQNATQLVGAVANGQRIPDELVVRLKPGMKIEDLAKLLGAKVAGRIDGLNAYRLRFENEAAADTAKRELAANPDVADIDANYSLERPPSNLGLQNRPGVPQLQMRSPSDSGRLVVGLIDTAVQPLGNDLDQFLQKQVSVAGPSQVDPNTISHGTAMAQTMLRGLEDFTHGSTSVQILPIDVYGTGETTSTFEVAKGIIEAVKRDAKLINLSLGSPADSPFLHDVVRYAQANKVLLISAAGNTPVTTPFFPAAYPEVWAVTAVEQGQIAPYANRGSFISLAAPGGNLVTFGSQTYGVQGTSVSSALLSGIAAGYMEVNRASPAQTQNFLQGNFGFTIGPGTSGTP